MTRLARAPRGPLARDDRGAIMVVGVFMGAFLVGALWYAIGVGDAILYKQRVQDGADAVVFAAAVNHARGMNMIAMINLIMAAILGVLVAVKLLQLVNAIANAVSCASSGLSLGTCAICDAVCGITSSLESPIQSTVDAVTQVVKTTLPALSQVEVAIALGMPWVGEGKGVVAAKSYDAPVKSGAIVTSSLLPYTPVGNAGQPKIGLPVQEGPYSELCRKAGETVGSVAFAPFGSFGSWVGDLVGGLVSTFPAYFCAGSDVSAQGALPTQTLDGAAQAACQAQYDKLSPKDQKSFDMSGCQKQQKQTMQQNLQKQGSFSGTSLDGSKMTPKIVFDQAQNGDGYFQLWGLVTADDAFTARAGKGVEVAAWNKGKAPAPAAWGKAGFAQAEFWYVPKSGQQNRPWTDYGDDAMWNLRWRARLRRFRPSQMTGGLLGDLGGNLLDKLDGAAQAALGDAAVMGMMSGQTPQQVDGNTSQVFDPAGLFGSLPEDPRLMDPTGVKVIH